MIKLYIENITEIFVLVYLGEINIIESILNMWLIFIFCAKYFRTGKDILGRIYFDGPQKSDIVIINTHDP